MMEQQQQQQQQQHDEEKEQKDAEVSQVHLGLFPTAVTEEKLEEARQKSLRRLFGTTESLWFIQDSDQQMGALEGVLQKKAREHCKEGDMYFSEGEWERAVVCYTKARNLDPNKVDIYEKTAEAFLHLCDFQSAAMHLRKACSLSPVKKKFAARLAFILQLQGQCLYEQKIYLDALESFTRAAELQPHCTLYRMRSIACLAALKRYNACLQMVSEETTREKNPDLYVLRARLYRYFGKVTLSFYNIQEALELDPEHAEAQAMLRTWKSYAQRAKDQAVNKATKGDLKAALPKITKAIDYNPLEANYFLLRGSILRRLKDFQGAIDDYLKAVDLSKADDEGNQVHSEAQKQVLLSYNDFAVHCYAKGCYEEGVLLLNKAIKGEKNEQGLYINRGDCFLQLGELNFAMADYQQALELKPLDAGLHKRVAWLHNEMGLQEFQERRFVQAEAFFSRAIENNPQELKYYLHRAKSRMFLQEVMGAKEDIVTALILDPTKEEVYILADNFFPGESMHSLLNGKIGILAKALLNQKLKACQAYKAPAQHERPKMQGKELPKDVYVVNEYREKSKEEKKDPEEQRLAQRVASCQKKTHKVDQELKEAREKAAPLHPTHFRLDPCPHLPEKEQNLEEPYQWKKFTHGIGHF